MEIMSMDDELTPLLLEIRTWQAGKTYYPGDQIIIGGRLFACIKNHIAIFKPTANSCEWIMLPHQSV